MHRVCREGRDGGQLQRRPPLCSSTAKASRLIHGAGTLADRGRWIYNGRLAELMCMQHAAAAAAESAAAVEGRRVCVGGLRISEATGGRPQSLLFSDLDQQQGRDSMRIEAWAGGPGPRQCVAENNSLLLLCETGTGTFRVSCLFTAHLSLSCRCQSQRFPSGSIGADRLAGPVVPWPALSRVSGRCCWCCSRGLPVVLFVW